MNKELSSKIKVWLKDRQNLAILGIIFLSFAIRLYFLITTSGQTLWWDEAEYGATAKSFFTSLDYPLNNQRPMMFPAVLGLLQILSLPETLIKFLLTVIPSVGLVFAIYLLGNKLYGKKVAMIASLFAATSWTFVFWSARLQPDFISMLFQVLAIYFMWNYWENPSKKSIIYSAIFASLGFNFKVSGLLVPMIFLVFIFFREDFRFLKKKDYWIFLGVFLLFLVPQFIYSQIAFGSTTAFLFSSGYASVVLENKPFAWYVIKFFYFLTENVLFGLFLIGLIISARFLLYLDILFKNRKTTLNAQFLSIISLIIILIFYVFYVRDTEDRWVFLWLPFIFYLAADACVFIFDKIKVYSRPIAVFVLALLLLTISYSQISHANQLIKLKQETYNPVKDASVWIRDNSQTDDLVFTISLPQTAYYSERRVATYSNITSAENFSEYIKKLHPQFILLSLYERHPTWAIGQGNQGGYDFLVLPYFNSTIYSQNGQIVAYDIKKDYSRDGLDFTLIYPTNALDGAFVYRVEYG